MLVSGGYPGEYEKGKEIKNLDKIKDSIVFHAGTKAENKKVVTSGGRVLAISSFGKNMRDALQTSYTNAALVDFDMDILQDMIFSGLRTNLGKEAPALDVFRLQDADPASRRYE